MEQKRLKVGIIGCGGIANGKHMPSLSRLRTCRTWSPSATSSRSARRRPPRNTARPARRFIPTIRNCWPIRSIDVVHVCTPNRSHADISVDALHAGKHVMCEKPMAKSAPPTPSKMVDAAQGNRQEADHRLSEPPHAPTAQYLKAMHRARRSGRYLLRQGATPSAAAASPPGACSSTSMSRAAAP